MELYLTPHHLTFVLAPLLDYMLVHDYGPLPSSKKLLYVFLYGEVVTCSSYHSDSSVVAGAIELLGDKVLTWYSSSMDNSQSCAHSMHILGINNLLDIGTS